MSVNCSSNSTVLHLIDTTGPGGAETVFVQLADLMRGRGYKSVVVIRGPGWVKDELERRGITPIIIDAKGSFNIGFLLSLRAIIKREGVGLIHSHLLGSNIYAALAGLMTRVPVIATYHGMVDVSPNERFKTIKHLAMKWGIDRYVTVSQRLLDNVLQQGLLNPNKTSIIYNGVDTDKYQRTTSVLIKKQLELHDDAILIGSLGNIRTAKAYDVLIKAAAKVLPKHSNLHFVIAGDPKEPLMTELTNLINQLGIADHMHFLGFQQDCAAVLAQMDMFALSSSSEGFSISTIEAMATGLPALVTRCGGPEEIITHGQTGYLVAVNNPQALADGIIDLLNHPELQRSLARAGQQHARATFGLDAMLNGYDGLYQELV